MLHALHTHILIAHLPQTSSTSLLLSLFQLPNQHALFSSAILNSCHATSLSIVSRKLATRIVNCLVISSSLSKNGYPEPHWDLPETWERPSYVYHAMDMLYRLCRAAELSNCCQEYMCKPDTFYARHGKDGKLQADKHLEIAMLVVCGYEIQSTKKRMIRLARIGRLIGHGGENVA